jgi:hypothetical protein
VRQLRLAKLLAARGRSFGRGRGAAASTIMAELRGSVGHAPAINLSYPGAGDRYCGFPLYFPFFTAAETDETGGSVQADALVPGSLGGDGSA